MSDNEALHQNNDRESNILPHLDDLVKENEEFVLAVELDKEELDVEVIYGESVPTMRCKRGIFSVTPTFFSLRPDTPAIHHETNIQLNTPSQDDEFLNGNDEFFLNRIGVVTKQTSFQQNQNIANIYANQERVVVNGLIFEYADGSRSGKIIEFVSNTENDKICYFDIDIHDNSIIEQLIYTNHFHKPYPKKKINWIPYPYLPHHPQELILYQSYHGALHHYNISQQLF